MTSPKTNITPATAKNQSLSDILDHVSPESYEQQTADILQKNIGKVFWDDTGIGPFVPLSVEGTNIVCLAEDQHGVLYIYVEAAKKFCIGRAPR